MIKNAIQKAFTDQARAAHAGIDPHNAPVAPPTSTYTTAQWETPPPGTFMGAPPSREAPIFPGGGIEMTDMSQQIRSHPVTRDLRVTSDQLLDPTSTSALADFDMPEVLDHASNLIVHLRELKEAYTFVKEKVPLYTSWAQSMADQWNAKGQQQDDLHGGAGHFDSNFNWVYPDGYVHHASWEESKHDLIQIPRTAYDEEVRQPELHASAMSDIKRMEEYPVGTFDDEIAQLKDLLGHNLELTDQDKDNMDFDEQQFNTPSKRGRSVTMDDGMTPSYKRMKLIHAMENNDAGDGPGKGHPWYANQGVTWGSDTYSYKKSKRSVSKKKKYSRKGKKGKKLLSKAAFMRLSRGKQSELIDALPGGQPYLDWSVEQHSFGGDSGKSKYNVHRRGGARLPGNFQPASRRVTPYGTRSKWARGGPGYNTMYHHPDAPRGDGYRYERHPGSMLKYRQRDLPKNRGFR